MPLFAEKLQRAYPKILCGRVTRGGKAAEAVSRPVKVKGGLLRPYGARNDTATIFSDRFKGQHRAVLAFARA